MRFTCFRAIFLWLCSKDLSRLTFDRVQEGSPEEILMNLSIGQTTYAAVFQILCRFDVLRFFSGQYSKTFIYLSSSSAAAAATQLLLGPL